MRKFLSVIVTFLVFLLLLVLGISFNLKNMIVTTANQFVKQEIKTTFIDTAKNATKEEIPAEVVEQVEEIIQKDERIETLLDTYFDQVMNILSDEQSNEKIHISSDLESFVEEGQKILEDYGISISEKEKEELLSSVSQEEMDKLVNDAITEVKVSMPKDAKVVLNVYRESTSTTFKIVSIVLIIGFLGIIGLLKKSYYEWMTNFGFASIAAGLILGFGFPIVLNIVTGFLNENIEIGVNSIRVYGYILIGLGVISYGLNAVLKSMDKNRKEKKESLGAE